DLQPKRGFQRTRKNSDGLRSEAIEVVALEGGRDGKLDNASRDPAEWLKNIEATETSNEEVVRGGVHPKQGRAAHSGSGFSDEEDGNGVAQLLERRRLETQVRKFLVKSIGGDCAQ
ncbi:hypothetical protein U1Q18_010801, partial [Sarracenia purpurea var. burkii]